MHSQISRSVWLTEGEHTNKHSTCTHAQAHSWKGALAHHLTLAPRTRNILHPTGRSWCPLSRLETRARTPLQFSEDYCMCCKLISIYAAANVSLDTKNTGSFWLSLSNERKAHELYNPTLRWPKKKKKREKVSFTVANSGLHHEPYKTWCPLPIRSSSLNHLLSKNFF